MTVATPARRARARANPAVLIPPAPPRKQRDLGGLHLRVDGVPYLIGTVLTGDCALELTVDGTSTLTLTILDVGLKLPAILADERTLLSDGVRVVLDEISYVLTNVDGPTDHTWSLTFEDEVSWRLRGYAKYRAKSRGRVTRAGFVNELCDEASRAPLTELRRFIPEIRDKQKIAKPSGTSTSTSGQAGRSKGLGSASITVKGARANSRQRDIIDRSLTEAAQIGAGRRPMIALIMAKTQESRMGEDTRLTGNDDIGDLQQGRNWLSLADARKPEKTTRAFFLGPDSGLGGTAPGWKQKHGSVKNAPADLGRAVADVQAPRDPTGKAYNDWKTEATKTVDAWLGSSGDTEITRAKGYLFTRGSKDPGEREDSWQASGRLAEEVSWLRWAALNTFWFVSQPELRAAAPSLTIRGNEPWLTTAPNGSWGGAGRPTAEVTMTVLSERWAVLPGAVALLDSDLGHLQGRWLVTTVRDDLRGPTTDITLRRPTPTKPEPAHETSTTTVDDGDSGAGGSVREASEHISDKKLPYVWGGGHARCGTPDRGTGRDPGTGYDCSGSVAAAAAAAGVGRVKKGQPVPGSGSWSQVLKPGKGKEWTCWANTTHVWIEFADGSRFDTAPQSGDKDESRGPRIREGGRRKDTSRFDPFHW